MGVLVLLFITVILLLVSWITFQEIRKIREIATSTVRGAAQGAVEIKSKVGAGDSNHYYHYKLEIKNSKYSSWTTIHESGQTPNFLCLEDEGETCWVDMNMVDIAAPETTKTITAADLKSESSIWETVSSKVELATDIRTVEKSILPGSEVFCTGNFVSGTATQPPIGRVRHLRDDDFRKLWEKLVQKVEGIQNTNELTGSKMINLLTMNRFGIISTPVIISSSQERTLLKRKWKQLFLLALLSLIFLSLTCSVFI